MDFLNLAENRYSIRKFDGRKIEDEVIEKILRAGQIAPTACNFQPQRILVIKGDDALAKLKECTRCHFDAPAAMLVCYNKEECWTRKYDGEQSGWVDASIVTTHMMLAASSLGIGTTWVMHFNPQAMREAFAIPENMVPVALLPMGYPAEDAEPLNLHFINKSLDEMVVLDTF